jgi:hypothetical protein
MTSAEGAPGMPIVVKGVLGLIFTVLVLVVLAMVAGAWSLDRQLRREVGALLAESRSSGGRMVTQAMLADLPAPVRRYLTHTGVVGKTIPRTVRLAYTGRIRQGSERAWMPLAAAQYYTVTPPGFIWIATVRIAGLPVMRVRDAYRNGRGAMLVKAGSLITVVDAAGPQMDQGAMMRYLNEMTWFPAAFLGESVRWKAIDDRSAEVTFTDHGRSITATMYFDADGRFVNFVGRRYRAVDSGYTLETWSTPNTGYGVFEGLRLPVSGKGVWNLAEGDQVYIELTLTRLEYDPDTAD